MSKKIEMTKMVKIFLISFVSLFFIALLAYIFSPANISTAEKKNVAENASSTKMNAPQPIIEANPQIIPVEDSALLADVSPLYPSLNWNEPFATSTLAFGMYLTGYKIDSKSISDSEYNKVDISFPDYYDKILVAKGWEGSIDFMADGPGSSVRAYTKGNKMIVLSYTSSELNPKSDQPFSCPCNMTFSIFLGDLK